MLLTALTGAAVALLASVLELEAPAREAAQWGALLSTAVGLLAVAWKGRVAATETEGTRSLRAFFTVQVLMLGIRAVVVFLGAFLVKPRGEAALVAFVLSFFAVYLLQQVVEVRLLLSARGARTVSR
jgi:cytochrome bd-type quinol oxidase subunit 2